MAITRFIPVDIDRNSAAMFTVINQYPITKLEAAYRYLNGDTSITGVIYDTVIKFSDDESIAWTVSDVIAAYEYYRIARDNHFSFYKVCNEFGSPILLVSKLFAKTRIVINLATFEAAYITNKSLLEKLTGMIDKRVETCEALSTFNAIADIEYNRHRYLDAVIVNRNTPGEYMCVTPIKLPNATNNNVFEPIIYNELIAIAHKDTPRTTHYELDNGNIIGNMSDCKESYSLSTIKFIEKLHNKVYNTKSNYCEIFDGVSDKPVYFVSTNFRYVVDVATFRYYVIKNAAVIDLVKSFISIRVVERDRLEMFKHILEVTDTTDNDITMRQ